MKGERARERDLKKTDILFDDDEIDGRKNSYTSVESCQLRY